MIPGVSCPFSPISGKPRASGDDPPTRSEKSRTSGKPRASGDDPFSSLMPAPGRE